LVANTVSTSNGTSNFLPVCSVRKSTRLSSGHDPAVQELVGTDALPSEVVHQEHAAVGAHLQRRLVEARQRVEREIELIERQLAAHHHDGTADAHPAAGRAAPRQ
jgi:hypothetical protein